VTLAFAEVPLYGFLDQIVGTAVLLFLIMAAVEHAPDWQASQETG
jgi:hypothetical protein